MSEKIDLTPDKTDQSSETGSGGNKEKFSAKTFFKKIGVGVLITIALHSAKYALEEYADKVRNPDGHYTVSDVVEPGDTSKDLAKNVQKDLFVNNFEIIFPSDLKQIENKINDIKRSDVINPGAKIITNMDSVPSDFGPKRDFDVQIFDPSKDAE